MKKLFYYLAFLLLAVWSVSACSDKDEIIDNHDNDTEVAPEQNHGWTLVITDNLTRGLDLSGDTNTLTPTWETTDDIHVYYKGNKVGVLNPESAGSGTKQLVGRLDGTSPSYEAGETLELYYRREKTATPVYTGQNGTVADIAANFDFAVATPTITAVDYEDLVLTIDTAEFASEEAVIRFKFDQNLQSGDELTILALNAEDGIVEATATVTLASAVAANNPVYVAIPVDNTNPQHFDVTVTRSDEDILTGGAANKNLRNGKYYSAPVALSDSWQLWAGGPAFRIKNLGAAKITDGGLYYAWGDTQGYYPAENHAFDWSTYKWSYDNAGNYFRKYISKQTGIYAQFNDGLFFLDSSDDAATAALGSPWRMLEGDNGPGIYEVNDLIECFYDGSITAVEYLGENKYQGGNGVLLRGTGDFYNNSIFLPYSGYYEDGILTKLGEEFNSWTSARWGSKIGCSFYWTREGDELETDTWQDERRNGLNIRPVKTVE